MPSEFDQLINAATQAMLADEIVMLTAAVAAEAQSPEFAARALASKHATSLRQDQVMPAAALQAYGAAEAGPVFAAAPAGNPSAPADALRQLLTATCGAQRVQALSQDQSAGRDFKRRLLSAIALKAADLVAVELLRNSQAPIAIDDPKEAALFHERVEAQHRRHVTLLSDFLRTLPQRAPALAPELLPTLAQAIRSDIAERYPSTQIRQAIDDIVQDALAQAAPR